MSIDAFLQELFPPGASAGIPPSFDERFAPSLPAGDASLPPNAMPTAGTLDGGIPAPGAPMPTPRPPIEALLAGPRPRPPEAGPSAADLAGGAAPPAELSSASPVPTGGPDGLFARLAGLQNGGMTNPTTPAPTNANDPRSVLGRLVGMDATGEKRFRNAIAGGFAGANPAFKGGAAMTGISGGLKGGLASDEQDQQQKIAAATKAQAQSNFERTQGDKELTSEALRKLYGDRGTALVTAADAKANPKSSTAWNKPPHERYKDAMKLIQAERKSIYGSIPPFGSREAQAAAKAEADKRIGDFTKRTLQQYGIDENGNETAPGPRSGKPTTQAPPGVTYDTESISNAREAIARGANPDQVKQHLKDNGIAFTDEDLAL